MKLGHASVLQQCPPLGYFLSLFFLNKIKNRLNFFLHLLTSSESQTDVENTGNRVSFILLPKKIKTC